MLDPPRHPFDPEPAEAASSVPAGSRPASGELAWVERLYAIPRAARLAVALAGVAAAFLLRVALVPLISVHAPYLTVAPVAMLAALVAGVGPGVAAAAVGAGLVELWIAHPSAGTAGEVVAAARAALLVAGAVLVGRIGASFRATHASLRRQNAELEASRAQARAGEAILAQAGEMAHLGAWWVDLADPAAVTDPDGHVHWSEEVFRILGLAPGAVTPSNELFLAHVPPEDRPRIVEAVQRALEERRPYSCEHRVIRPDGTERVVVERALLVVAPDGRAVRLLGTVQDVTERKRAEEALREKEERFRAITEAMPQIVCVLRPDGSPEYVNAQWRAFSGLDDAATARAGWAGILHPDDFAAARECRRRVLETGEPQEVELRYRGAGGGYRWFLSRLAPVRAGTGPVVRLVGAAMDITARKEAEQALRDADRRKTEFLGMLSHELRNPLAPIRYSIHLLERAGPDTAQARRAREVIARQSEHLTRLVDDLLDVTRIARGKIELRRTPVDLGEVVRRTAEDLRSVLDAGGLSLEVVLPDAPASIYGDPTRLAQVVGNLLQNAAKFTPPGGRVTLALVHEDGVAEIRVSDTGVGIEPELLARVFEPFVQGERSLARTQGGLGLGLALVKGIAELHGGTVRATSAGADRGAELAVRLPLAPPVSRRSGASAG
jgi:PAS domain S-box-containing protein